MAKSHSDSSEPSSERDFRRIAAIKTDAAREIANRLEGKAVQPIVGDNTASTSVTLNIEVVRRKLFGDDE